MGQPSEKKIAIILDGGLIQNVYANFEDCMCTVVDLDTADMDPRDLNELPSGKSCFIRDQEVTFVPGDLSQFKESPVVVVIDGHASFDYE